MYKEKSQDWMKHLDFIVIDLLMLLLAFVLAYLTRYGFTCGIRKSMSVWR